MKLFLCGGGSGKLILSALEKFADVIDKEKQILYVPFAMPEEKYGSCYNWFKSEMDIIGIKSFEMVESSLELSEKDLNIYSAIFIGGGNTYKLLEQLKEHDNFIKIKNYLNDGGVIFGGSAGAIIFGKDIDSCLLDDDKPDNYEDTKGFNLLNDYSILCHYDPIYFDKRKEYLEEFFNLNKVIYLPEELVIYVENDKFSMIGNGDYLLIKNGKTIICNSKNFNKENILTK